jgi:integrase
VRNITYLFTNQHGQQITKTGYNSATSRIRKKADLMDIHFHDIRGSALTDAEKDGDIHYAQSLAGHDSLATTEGYLRRKKIDYVKPLK